MYFLRRYMVVVFLALSAAAFAASPLEKTEWRVEITQEGMTLPLYVDRLRFYEGKFNSVIFGRKGFPTPSYTLTEKGGGSLAWEARQESDTKDNLVWRGELSGDALKGALVWTQPDGKTTNYSLAGAPAEEEPSAEESAAAEVSASKTKAGKKSSWGCSLIQIR